MADDVNFIPTEHKKKPQEHGVDIEYTEGEKYEEVVDSPSLKKDIEIDKSVEKKPSSFFEWRMARKHKRDAEKEHIRKIADELAAEKKKENDARKEHERTAQELRQKKAEHTIASKPRIVEEKKKPEPVVIAPNLSPETPHVEVAQKEKSLVMPSRESVHTPMKAKIAPPTAPRTEKPHEPEQVVVEPELPSEHIMSVNLIPDALFDQLRSQNRLRDLAVVAGLMCVFMMTIYAGFNIYRDKLQRDTHDVISQIQRIDDQIDAQEPLRQEAEVAYNQILAVQDVLAKHIEWTPFFSYLEEWTLPNVYYDSMTGSATTGEFTLSALTTDLRFISAQVDAFRRSPHIKSVTTTSAVQSLNEQTNTNNAAASSVRFTLTIVFDTAVFHSDTYN